MGDSARPRAGDAEVLVPPPHRVAEVVGGTLAAQRRPALRSAQVSLALGAELGPPFGRGRGGPGGWILRAGLFDAVALEMSVLWAR